MCIHICVALHVYVSICIYIYKSCIHNYTYTCICIYTYISMFIDMDMHAKAHECIQRNIAAPTQ